MHKESRIYLVGGMPRCGKSSLARYMMSEKKIAYTSTDILRCVLQSQAPQLGIHGKGRWSEKATIFYPYLKDLVYLHSEVALPHCIEGEVVSPQIAAEMRDRYGARACFLGYSKMTPEILRTRTGLNDWITELTDAEVEDEARWIAEGSYEFQSEAAKYGFPYFELASGRAEHLEQVFASFA